MDLTAVVVTHNSEAVIGDCLDALIASGVPRVLVVDNASSDHSCSVVERLVDEGQAVDLLPLSENVGFGRAVNLAAPVSVGHLLLVNPDLFLNPAALEAITRAIHLDPTVGCSSCRLELADGSIDAACLRRIPGPLSAAAYLLRRLPLVARLSRYHPHPSEYFVASADVEAVNGALMLVRRSAFESVGGFDERFFMYGEDLDLCVALRAAGWTIRYRGDVSALHLKGSSSGPGPRSGRAAVAFEEAMWLFFDKHQAGTLPRIVSAALRFAMRLRARAVLGAHDYGEYLSAVAHSRIGLPPETMTGELGGPHG